MKYILTLIIATMTLGAFSQNSQRIGKYAAVSYSLSNGSKINSASYASAEVGLTKDNAAFGLAIGRSSFVKDADNQWFIEPKTSVILVEKGIARGYATFGAGCWPGTNNFFVEYGAGILFAARQSNDLSLQWSNWAGGNYVSIGYVVSF